MDSILPPSFLEPSIPSPGGPIGIAKMAAESEHSQLRNDVDYRWINSRSTLNRVNGKRVSFEWTINPYRGCEFGCAYCYARYTHEFMNHEDPDDFERIIYLKRNAAEWLKRELARGNCAEGETIVLGGATDPYQPAEKKYGITRSILEKLALVSGFRIGITTKSDLVTRDIDILQSVAKRHHLSINVSVTTTDMKLARKLEPRAPTPRSRLDAVKKLNASGVPAGVMLAPILPSITDSPENMESVIRAASEVNAQFVHWSVLFLASCSRKKYEPFIREQFPHLSKLYEEYYRDGMDAPDFYKRRIKQMVTELLQRHGMTERSTAWREQEAERPLSYDSQQELFPV